jgi:small multidrug resistance family-3 protein
MQLLQTIALFAATAVAEIVGCYLPYLWLRKDASIWLLIPAGASFEN